MKRSDFVLDALKTKPSPRLLGTREEVHDFKRRLDETTKKSFQALDLARRRALDLAAKRFLD
jgi:hypothetical protein